MERRCTTAVRTEYERCFFMSDKKYVKSVLKALDVIELLNERGELGVTEIGLLRGLDKSTTFRMLATLKERGYIVTNPQTQKYANSGKFFMLGQGILDRHNVNPLLRLELKRLSEVTGETVNLAVADGLEGLYIDRHETEDSIKLAGALFS